MQGERIARDLISFYYCNNSTGGPGAIKNNESFISAIIIFHLKACMDVCPHTPMNWR